MMHLIRREEGNLYVFLLLIIKITDTNRHKSDSKEKTIKPLRHVTWFCLMAVNATFNNISVISWRSVLFVEETGVPGKNHRPVASHWRTLSHNVVHLALIEIRTRNISTDCIGSYKSNYHTMMATTAPDTESAYISIKNLLKLFSWPEWHPQPFFCCLPLWLSVLR